MLELIETHQYDHLTYYIVVRAVIVLVCWLFMAASNIVDFFSGINTARALGQKLKSHAFRRTITKIRDYAQIMLFALMFDALGSLLPFYAVPFATMLCTLAVMCIEGKSVIENSRRKKAHAGEIPDILRQIVEATTQEQGKDILKRIAELLALGEKSRDYEKNR